MVVGSVDPALVGNILGDLEEAEARRHRNDRIHHGHDRHYQGVDESDAVHNDDLGPEPRVGYASSSGLVCGDVLDGRSMSPEIISCWVGKGMLTPLASSRDRASSATADGTA